MLGCCLVPLNMFRRTKNWPLRADCKRMSHGDCSTRVRPGVLLRLPSEHKGGRSMLLKILDFPLVFLCLLDAWKCP